MLVIRKKVEIFGAYDVIRDHIVIVKRHELPLELLGILRLYNLEANELENWQDATQNKMVSHRNERVTLRESITHLRRILDAYGTSITEDEKILKIKKGRISDNYYMAVQYRLLEKEMLTQVIRSLELLQGEFFKYTQLSPTSEDIVETSSKKKSDKKKKN